MRSFYEQEFLISSPSYEYKRGPVVDFLRIQFLGFLGLLPKKISQKIFLAFSGRKDDAFVVFKNVKRWKALEVLYTYRQRKLNRASIFWGIMLDNARSIRNRLNLVKKELGKVISIMVNEDEKKSVRLLSIGSGSARSVIETILSLNEQNRVEVLLIDADKTAIEFSESFAKFCGVNYTTRLTGNFFRLEQDAAEFNPSIVELVGLLDYLTDKQTIALLRKVFRILQPNGYLLTSNIVPNKEAPFVTKGLNWQMIYRTPDTLKSLITDAGFLKENVSVQQEPLGIHSIALCRKI